MKNKSQSVFFSTTNVYSQRYKSFLKYFKNDSFFVNLMSANKLNSPVRNTIIYVFLFFPTFLLLFFRLMFRDLTKLKNIIVPFPGILDLLFLYPICKIFKINLIYDSFVNFEQTLINDRKLFKNKILMKIINKFDSLYIQLSDYLIVETEQIKDYYIKKYNLDKLKVIVLLSPREVNTDSLVDLKLKNNTVLYFGSYVPLNGTEYIIEAANLLKNKNINFLMIGDGQDKKKCLELARKFRLENIKFIDTLPFHSNNPQKSLVNYIYSCDISLGTFSNSQKNDQVVPGKVVDALAIGKKIITSNTTSINFYLKNSVIKINSGSSNELASKILEALENKKFENIEKNAIQAHSKFFSKKAFTETLERELARV